MKQLSSLLKSLVLFLCASLLFFSLFTYNAKDISFLSYPVTTKLNNIIGFLGAYVSFVLFFLIGYAAYLFPCYLFLLGFSKLEKIRFDGLGKGILTKSLSGVFFVIFFAALLGIFSKDNSTIFQYAGIVGFYISRFFIKYLGFTGAFLTLSFILIINSLLLFGLFFVDFFRLLKTGILKLLNFIQQYKNNEQVNVQERIVAPVRKRERLPIEKDVAPVIKVYEPTKKSADFQETVEVAVKEKKTISVEDIPIANQTYDARNYVLPSINLMKVYESYDPKEAKEDIHINIKNLEDTLLDFGVEAKVVSVQKGPVVTMYELKPIAGVKIQKIAVLADDIALAMKSSAVRIVAPLPGRGTVGVEIPNLSKHLVFLREVIEEKVFRNNTSKLTFAIGKDVSGNPVVADIKEMPHLLIAGATGTGKTVCVNSLISSILFRAKPDEVKFILIDPKMVEMVSFANIPHLLHPIVTEAKKAFMVLNWAVEEMERRYRILAKAAVRNIEFYNQLGKDKLPYILLVVDELADLMVVARDNIETAIQRLAQLSRAVGIHLVLATQRPSVDVITGVIKANFPARISFKVSSKVDSRTVLDANGADKLLGKGDLLFLKPGATKLIRAQGCFLYEEDINNVTSFVRSQGAPVYDSGLQNTETLKRKNLNQEDDLFDEAVKTILIAKQASASILQRRIRVGYTRAARLLDLMEEQGIVGPFCGSKAREIIVDPEKYLQERYPVL